MGTVKQDGRVPSTVYFPPALHSWIRRQADVEDTTMTELVTRACAAYKRETEHEMKIRGELARTAAAITPAPALDTIRQRASGGVTDA